MNENYLGNLVNQAKGDDRSIREYSRDSGVDATVISKIIKGTYTPRKYAVYESLTSEDAKPRNGITTDQLIKAAGLENGFREGVIAGREALENLIASYGSVAIASVEPLVGASTSLIKAARSVTSQKTKKSTKGSVQKRTENVQKQIKRFVTLSKTIIFGNLALKGIQFSEKEGDYAEILENVYDTYLKVKNADFEEIIIRFVYIMPEDEGNTFLIENTSFNIVGQLVFLPDDAKRKVLVTTNSRNVFCFLQKFQGKMSYKGNLSIELIDSEEYQIIDEKNISIYSYQ